MARNNGFTLIELMIVIAIIAILAAIAIPQYQDFTKRAKISEGIVLADAAKWAIAESYGGRGVFPASPAEAGYQTGKSTFVSQVTVKSGGIIEVTFRNIKDANIDQKTMLLTPTAANGIITWSCNGATGFGNKGTVAGKFLPATCR